MPGCRIGAIGATTEGMAFARITPTTAIVPRVCPRTPLVAECRVGRIGAIGATTEGVAFARITPTTSIVSRVCPRTPLVAECRVGRIGAIDATTEGVAFARIAPTTAIVPRVCPRTPLVAECRAAELVRSTQPLKARLSPESLQPRQSFRGSVPARLRWPNAGSAELL
jgi:hypothetical protein